MKKKKILIPHIHYTVTVICGGKAPVDLQNALAWAVSDGKYGCRVYLPKGRILAGDLAHELIHVLQFIALERNIDFTMEREHFGYLMHWLMGEIGGRKYESD